MEKTESFGKGKRTLKVAAQECLTEGIYSMWIEAEDMAEAAAPGQFLSGNEKTTEVPIYVKKKPNKTEIILVDNNGDISIFKENISLALTACGCWIVGAILCMFA